jgi:hypothetical protein
MIPRGFVVLKPGHEETEENLTNFLESRLQVKMILFEPRLLINRFR